MDFSKKAFIRLALDCNVLKFGEFTLKSGRLSPYFFNAGLFYEGQALRSLGQFYANTFATNAIMAQHLFGPAYKGLPLATATAIALAERDIHTTVTFNRKEIKDHGEGGQLIGAPLHGNTVMIDDVITAGTAFREAQQFIKDGGGKLTDVIIALDRCERGKNNTSAIADIKKEGINVFSIITFFDLVDYLTFQGDTDKVNQLENYHKEYA